MHKCQKCRKGIYTLIHKSIRGYECTVCGHRPELMKLRTLIKIVENITK